MKLTRSELKDQSICRCFFFFPEPRVYATGKSNLFRCEQSLLSPGLPLLRLKFLGMRGNAGNPLPQIQSTLLLDEIGRWKVGRKSQEYEVVDLCVEHNTCHSKPAISCDLICTQTHLSNEIDAYYDSTAHPRTSYGHMQILQLGGICPS